MRTEPCSTPHRKDQENNLSPLNQYWLEMALEKGRETLKKDVMIQTQDMDFKSEFEETVPVEPVEYQPQDTPSQESHEADQTQGTTWTAGTVR